MSYREAFDETVKLFELRASEIADKSGIGENQISRFRHGKTDLQTASLEKLINVLPAKAKAYFYSMVMVNAS
jgi:transcriptional regulator with XRE-family HTH domain